ncbi:hypothetical protein HK096_006527 [Nowakowskiella sp. JEL0078]|nr:hypothetical protein HK096_006527 [Nowakowskiella sp. JEL0078]
MLDYIDKHLKDLENSEINISEICNLLERLIYNLEVFTKFALENKLSIPKNCTVTSALFDIFTAFNTTTYTAYKQSKGQRRHVIKVATMTRRYNQLTRAVYNINSTIDARPYTLKNFAKLNKSDFNKMSFIYAIVLLDTDDLALSLLTYILNSILRVEYTESSNSSELFKPVSRIDFIRGIYPHILGLLNLNIKKVPAHLPSDILDKFINANEIDRFNFGQAVEAILLKFDNLITNTSTTIAKNTEEFINIAPAFYKIVSRYYLNPMNFPMICAPKEINSEKDRPYISPIFQRIAPPVLRASHRGVSKKDDSFKLAWIQENLSKFKTFLDSDKTKWDWDFISTSDEPFQFIADATCSGIQHLSTMILNEDLASHVNVLPSIQPQDIYVNLANRILDQIQQDPALAIYKNIVIDRKMLKTAVMTISYNVSLSGFSDYIDKHFTKTWLDDAKTYTISPINYDGEIVILTAKQYGDFIVLLYQSIFKFFPDLKAIVQYFKQVTGILGKLNKPITWITPAGMPVADSVNIRTQSQAFSPNFVHSMDASNIYLLVNRLKEDMPLYTIHDCFASSVDKIELINKEVKEAFKRDDDQFIIIDNEEHAVPKLPANNWETKKVDWVRHIRKSRYFLM